MQKGVHQLHQIQAKQAQGFRGDVLSQRVQVGVHHAPEALRVHAFQRLAHFGQVGRRVSGGGRIVRRIQPQNAVTDICAARQRFAQAGDFGFQCGKRTRLAHAQGDIVPGLRAQRAE